MKAVFGFLMIAAFAVISSAQETKVLAEITAGASAVKNAPFSAEAVSESVQTLADGNRIVQSSTSKMYRNSAGQVRREMTGGKGGMMTFFNFEPGFSIAQPGGMRYWVDPSEKTARAMTVITPSELKIRERTPATEQERKAAEELRKLKGVPAGTELSDDQKKAVEVLRAKTVERTIVTPSGAAEAAVARGFATSGAGFGSFYFGRGPGDSKWETKTEELGTNNIEGTMAEGTRRTTTIPAGAIGNERPIEITYERWYSKELGMVVQSKHSDPRFGDQTYTLKNIVRSEPDPSLFAVPQGFKVLAPEPGSVFTTTVRAPRTPTPAVAPKQP